MCQPKSSDKQGDKNVGMPWKIYLQQPRIDRSINDQPTFSVLTRNCNCDLTGNLVTRIINCVVYNSVGRCFLVFKLKSITLLVCTRQGGNPCVHYCHIVRHTHQGGQDYRRIRLPCVCVHSDVARACNAWIFIIWFERQENNTLQPKSSITQY